MHMVNIKRSNVGIYDFVWENAYIDDFQITVEMYDTNEFVKSYRHEDTDQSKKENYFFAFTPQTRNSVEKLHEISLKFSCMPFCF